MKIRVKDDCLELQTETKKEWRMFKGLSSAAVTSRLVCFLRCDSALGFKVVVLPPPFTGEVEVVTGVSFDPTNATFNVSTSRRRFRKGLLIGEVLQPKEEDLKTGVRVAEVME